MHCACVHGRFVVKLPPFTHETRACLYPRLCVSPPRRHRADAVTGDDVASMAYRRQWGSMRPRRVGEKNGRRVGAGHRAIPIMLAGLSQTGTCSRPLQPSAHLQACSATCAIIITSSRTSSTFASYRGPRRLKTIRPRVIMAIRGRRKSVSCTAI